MVGCFLLFGGFFSPVGDLIVYFLSIYLFAFFFTLFAFFFLFFFLFFPFFVLFFVPLVSGFFCCSVGLDFRVV